jgi:circadian clock protein KaiC
MRSIGIDLEPPVRRGMLRFHAVLPSTCGLEMHLVTMHRLVSQFSPRIVVIDPVTNFAALGSEAEVKAMLTRLIEFLKMHQITTMFSSLTVGGTPLEATDLGVSSLMDTWLLLRDVQNGAERNRFLQIVKSRGMAHSNQMREFLLTDHGVDLRDVYIGPSGLLLAGGAREALEAQEKAQALVRGQDTEGKKRRLESRRQAMEAQVAVLQAEFEVEQAEVARTVGQDQTRAGVLAGDRAQMARQRQSDPGATGRASKHR